MQKEPVKLDDLLDPDSSLLEASKLWEEDNIARRVENNPTLKTELVRIVSSLCSFLHFLTFSVAVRTPALALIISPEFPIMTHKGH